MAVVVPYLTKIMGRKVRTFCNTNKQRTSLTCHDSRHNSRQQWSFGSLVHPGKETEEQPVLCHSVYHSRHGEHGAQQTTIKKTKNTQIQINRKYLTKTLLDTVKPLIYLVERAQSEPTATI